MATIGLMLLSWGYTAIIMFVFCCKTMERRYSYGWIALGTFVYYVVTCAVKIPLLFSEGSEALSWLNGLGIVFFLVISFILFKAEWPRRILAITFLWTYLLISEVTASGIAYLVTGSLEILEINSDYMLVGLMLVMLCMTVFLVPALWLWKQMLKIEWFFGRGQWLSILFPISQWGLFESYVIGCNNIYTVASLVSGVGIVLGVAGDCYMFRMFYRNGQELKAEDELRRLRYFREKDRIYYERLEKEVRETARIRHDFQNYLLMLQKVSGGDLKNREKLVDKLKEELWEEIERI